MRHNNNKFDSELSKVSRRFQLQILKRWISKNQKWGDIKHCLSKTIKRVLKTIKERGPAS